MTIYLLHPPVWRVPECTEQHDPAFPPRYVRGMKGDSRADAWACYECEKIALARLAACNGWWAERRDGVSHAG